MVTLEGPGYQKVISILNVDGPPILNQCVCPGDVVTFTS